MGDLGGTTLKICISDNKGDLTDLEEFPVAKIRNNLSDLENFIIEKININFSIAQERNEKISAICLSFPCIVNNKNIIVLSTNIINEFKLSRIKEYFSVKYDVHFSIINDVNSATIGEQWKGVIGYSDNALYINIGTGLSMGIIANGKLYLGANNAAGEMAYCIDDFIKPFDPNIGPLEEKFSGFGFKKQILKELIKDAPESGTWFADNLKKDFSNLDTKLIFNAYKENDPVAIKIIQDGIKVLSIHLVNIILILNPELIVFGGGVSRDSECFIPQIQSYLRMSIPFIPQISKAKLGRTVGLYGAVRHILNSKGDY